MKLGRIKIQKHHVFQDLELSFLDSDGKPFDTVIIAGENGTGKTKLLEFIFSCIQLKELPNYPITGAYEYDLILNEKECKIVMNGDERLENGITNNAVTIRRNTKNPAGIQLVASVVASDTGNMIEFQPSILLRSLKSNGIQWRSLYSNVANDVAKGQVISSITNQDVDSSQSIQNKSGPEIASVINQFLVDISALDAIDLQEWMTANEGKIPPKHIMHRRLHRFTYAYEQIMPHRKFHKIVNEGNSKYVQFKDNENTIRLTEFSSGEQQIVYRSSFLLKDRERHFGSIVCIDEPEASLHPRWQQKILNFYKGLFQYHDGTQFAQLFIATHSPFIVHDNNRYNDCVFILERNENEKVTVANLSGSYPDWTAEIAVKKAFKIDFNTRVTRNTVFVEGETDEQYFAEVIRLFDHKLSFDVKWIGRKIENGKTEFTGKSALDKLKNVFLARPELLQSSVILFYDNDCNKLDESFPKLLIRCAPSTTKNSVYQRGIESQLHLPDNFDKTIFLSEKFEDDGMGGEKIIKTTNKAKLCDWILKHTQRKDILQSLTKMLIEFENDFKKTSSELLNEN